MEMQEESIQILLKDITRKVYCSKHSRDENSKGCICL